MQFIKRKVRSEKELFLDLIYILDKYEDEECINYSILMFFENGEEIIKSKKQKEAYKDVINFISNNEFIKIYCDENLSVLEKTKRIIYINQNLVAKPPRKERGKYEESNNDTL